MPLFVPKRVRVSRTAKVAGKVSIVVNSEDLQRLRNRSETLSNHADAVRQLVQTAMESLGDDTVGIIRTTIERLGLPYTGQLTNTISADITETGQSYGGVRMPGLTVGSFAERTPSIESDTQRSPISYIAPLISGSRGGSVNRPHAGRIYAWIAAKLGLARKDPISRKIYMKIWRMGTIPHPFLDDAVTTPEWRDSIQRATEALAKGLLALVAGPFDFLPQAVDLAMKRVRETQGNVGGGSGGPGFTAKSEQLRRGRGA